ncbi:MAG: hypothetical protein JRJ85_20430, partial [Deltaproteobacteria bacterium]|nr:hypothetical protein [Deltaproteobacteria bacterium]
MTADNCAVTASGILTIGTGATLALGGSDTTLVNTGGSFDNKGTLQVEGDETLTDLTNDTAEGAVVYTGAGTYSSGLIAGDGYYDLTFNGSGSWQQNTDITVNGDFTVTQGTFNCNGYDITGNAILVNGGTLNANDAATDIDVSSHVVVTAGTLSAPPALDDTSFMVGGNWEISGS